MCLLRASAVTRASELQPREPELPQRWHSRSRSRVEVRKGLPIVLRCSPQTDSSDLEHPRRGMDELFRSLIQEGNYSQSNETCRLHACSLNTWHLPGIT